MLNKLKFLVIAICVFTAGLIAVNFAFAQSADSLLWGDTQNEVGNRIGLGSEDPRVMAAKIIRVFIGFLGIIAVVLIMYAGFLWMTSEGNEETVAKAKRVLKNAVIGLAIILISFGVVTFILNKFLGATGVGGLGGGGSPPSAGTGFGALGSCTVESVYPEPNQEEVPRNSIIIITFKEAVDPTTLCDDAGGNGNGVCDAGEYIIPENVRIYKTGAGDACGPPCDGNVLEVNVVTTDNKTFIFMPVNYLGSPSEYIWYSVHLTNDVEKVDKSGIDDGIFSTCNPGWMEWQFEVSNKIDLTPPQVKDGGIFPRPDNDQDEIAAASAAVQAEGGITVIDRPDVYVAAAIVSVAPGGGSQPASAVVDENNSEEGVLTVTVLADGSTARLNKGATLLGSAVFSDFSVTFPGYFTLTVGGAYSAGNSWNIDIIAEQQADTLIAGSIIYVFGEDISSSPSNNVTASNINTALSAHPAFDSSVAGNIVSLTAAVAGRSGNNIILAAGNESSLAITAMNGGTDPTITTTINDQKDQPRNAAIQINLNEAVNPLTVSGDAEDLQDYIAVKCVGGDCTGPEFFNCGGDICVYGSFAVSNRYRTVEFISDNQCGVNGCGENIYCLPENSNLRVDLAAADLDDCASASDCAVRSPYNDCENIGAYNVCRNADDINYPLSAYPLTGIADAASNSLDGNRDADADSPISFYDENVAGPGGDNFQWSFFINDLIDLSPPIIDSLSADHVNGSADVPLTDPVGINFSKLMLSSSLMTGSKTIINGGDEITHKNINIWNFTGKPTGYWITNEGVDTSSPPDGYPEYTRGLINHSMFSDATSYRSQVGSGVKDIYQNCFKPSAGPGCAATDANPSCCGEVLTAGSECP